MRTSRIATASPQVQLVATRACRSLGLYRRALNAALAGHATHADIVAMIADACESVGLWVHRGPRAVTIDAGTVDVAAAWRGVRPHVRRDHETLHAMSVAEHEAVAARRVARRQRDRSRAEREATHRDVADLVL